MASSIMIRSGDLSRELADRLRTYKLVKGVTTSAAAAQLLTIALDHLDARSAGAKAASRGLGQAGRIDRARRAAKARWGDRETEREE